MPFAVNLCQPGTSSTLDPPSSEAPSIEMKASLSLTCAAPMNPQAIPAEACKKRAKLVQGDVKLLV
jgi:hypothetical protein